MADLLALAQAHALPLDRMMLAILSTDDLLVGLGLDPAARLRWYRTQVPAQHETGDEYRHRKELLRALIGNPHYLLAQLNGGAVARIFAERRAALAPIAARLVELHRHGEMSQAPEALYRSFVHLHLNRLLGSEAAVEERRALGLLLRTLHGLERAPLVRRFALVD
jgi:thiopeptide-type bacteriocin biosynthesis protein